MESADTLWDDWQRLMADKAADPLEMARLASTFERYFDAVKTEAVKASRASGRTWEEVAAAVGTTRQSAWGRYRFSEKMKSGEGMVKAGRKFAGPIGNS